MEIEIFDSDKFISLIQSHRVLWDNSDPEYGDRVVRDDAWRAVISSMYGQDETETWSVEKKNEFGKSIQKKWKSFRNSFARELARRKKNPPGSGRAWKTYMYFDQLSFLIPTMRHSEVPSNLKNEQISETEGNEYATSIHRSESSARHTASRKRKSTNQIDEQYAGVSESVKWRSDKTNFLENDVDRFFLLSLLDDFKNIPSSNKAAVKISIIKCINEAQIDQSHRTIHEPLIRISPTLKPVHYEYDNNYYRLSQSVSNSQNKRTNSFRSSKSRSSHPPPHSNGTRNVRTSSPLPSTESESDDYKVSEESINELF